MGTWDKDTIFIQLVDSSDGTNDETSHTVKLQPIDQAYDTGAVSCSQASGFASRWTPDSDLDDEMHYDIYVDGTKIGRLQPPTAMAMIGG